MSQEKTVGFKGIGDNDQIQYNKSDIVKFCRINDNYTISFYQLDYQSVVNALKGVSKLKPEETKMIPVGKIVMNQNSFNEFVAELKKFNQILEDESKPRKSEISD